MFSSHKTHRFIKRISFPKFKTASFHFGIIIKKTRKQWSSSSQELRLRQPQLQLQEIFRRGEVQLQEILFQSACSFNQPVFEKSA